MSNVSQLGAIFEGKGGTPPQYRSNTSVGARGSPQGEKVPTFLAFVNNNGSPRGEDAPDVTKPGAVDVNKMNNVRKSYKGDADAYAHAHEGGETVKAKNTQVVSPGAHPWIGGSHGSTATTKKKIVIPPAGAY